MNWCVAKTGDSYQLRILSWRFGISLMNYLHGCWTQGVENEEWDVYAFIWQILIEKCQLWGSRLWQCVSDMASPPGISFREVGERWQINNTSWNYVIELNAVKKEDSMRIQRIMVDVAILDRRAKEALIKAFTEGLSEKILFERGLEWSKGESHMGVWGRKL